MFANYKVLVWKGANSCFVESLSSTVAAHHPVDIVVVHVLIEHSLCCRLATLQNKYRIVIITKGCLFPEIHYRSKDPG